MVVIELSDAERATLEVGFAALIHKLAGEQGLSVTQAISVDPTTDALFVGRATIRIGITKINDDRKFVVTTASRVVRLIDGLLNCKGPIIADKNAAIEAVSRLGRRSASPERIKALCAVAQTQLERWEP